mgnify:CR=1 FL=1
MIKKVISLQKPITQMNSTEVNFLRTHIQVLGKHNIAALKEFCEQNLEKHPQLSTLLELLPLNNNSLSRDEITRVREWFTTL